jgi:endo-1,4-beta-D-glucanase Y
MAKKIFLLGLIAILFFSITTPALAGTNSSADRSSASRPSAVPNLFVDVPQGHWAVAWINELYTEGVTGGCGTDPLRYCPDAVVTRAQMAVFLVRVIHGSTFTPPDTAVVFEDVPLDYWAISWINQLYADGVTGGCSMTPMLFCPDVNVSRAQMAVFLLRAKYGSTYTPPASGDIFSDVPADYWARDWIGQLYAEGYTGGCASAPLRFCPDEFVSRDQMSVFLLRAIHGADYIPPAIDLTYLRPFPQHVQYAQNSILPNHRTQTQLDDDVRAFYDYWKSQYLIEAGVNPDGITMFRVAFGKAEPNRSTTVSEGQGYGMLIVPVMAGYDPDAQVIFDGLWAFARAHPSEIDSRLMDWKVPQPDGNDSAFDGDADIAFGLLLADAQWGSAGRVNYKAEAEKMIGGVLESTIGPASHLPMLGDWTDANGATYNQYTPRSSDFMLTNFRAYGKATNDPVWGDVVAQSQSVITAIQNNYSLQTGLLPDFIVRKNGNFEPAPPNFLEDVTDGAYSYNAGRDPWRVGLDALLSNDGTSRTNVLKISHWIESATAGNPANIRAGYNLDGTPLPNSDYFTSFFVAPMGVAAMNDSAQQNWLNAVYDAVYGTRQDYYEDSVTLICLMVMTGNFWAP